MENDWKLPSLIQNWQLANKKLLTILPSHEQVGKKKQPKKKGKFFKVLLLLFVLGAGAFAAWYFLFPVQERNIYHFVPEDAMYVIESQKPIDNWKEFAESEIWQHLKNP